MPKILELRKIDGALWARLDLDLSSQDQPVHLFTQSEIDALEAEAIQDYRLSLDPRED